MPSESTNGAWDHSHCSGNWRIHSSKWPMMTVVSVWMSACRLPVSGTLISIASAMNRDWRPNLIDRATLRRAPNCNASVAAARETRTPCPKNGTRMPSPS